LHCPCLDEHRPQGTPNREFPTTAASYDARVPNDFPARVLVTGGAGFIGANLCIALRQSHPATAVVALDSLKRRGSEINVRRLREAGARFVHGDVRIREDLEAAGSFDAIVECSAEPSVLAGMGAGAGFVVQTNLVGACNCLELARRDAAQVVFLSTSRVYPVAPLAALPLVEEATRFRLQEDQALPGMSRAGVAEDFPLGGSRTLYGATKLAAELMITEYVEAFGIPAVINRCGVVAGPWQMGKVDQGVFTHWLLSHYDGRPLSYLGYGGSGKQVRDLLHVDDLCDLVAEQLADPAGWSGETVNVGGGVEGSLSLAETTDICRELTGREVPIEPVAEARPGDVPFYASDCSRLFARTDWRPSRDPRTILEDTFSWVRENELAVLGALG
jgi:CDP-paratose 2-epimerase